MNRSHFTHGLLLSTMSALTLLAACTDTGPDRPTDPAIATLVASPRSLADLGVTTWEVSPDGTDVRVIGRDAASQRKVDLIIRRDVAAPEDRVRIETLFPDRGEVELTRTGVVDGAASEYQRQLAADVHTDLGPGATPVASVNGLGTTTSALAIQEAGTIELGWQLWGRELRVTLGGRCRPGTIRDHAEIYADYGATATWTGWAYTAPDTDCSAKFYMYVNGGHSDTAHWAVFNQNVNLAASKTTTESSNPFGGNPSRAVDGNTDGNWYGNSVTHTGYEPNAWWQVDLSTRQALGQVVVYNRTDCCTDRLANFDVLLSDDGVTWVPGASFGGVAPVRTPLSLGGAYARFVRIQLQGTNYLSLAEVQVFAP